MAQRPIWEGHLRMSLVACPVSLFTTTGMSSGVNIHQVHPAGVATQTVCHETGAVVHQSYRPRTPDVRLGSSSPVFAAGTQVAATRAAVQ